MNLIGQPLRDLREELNLTQRELARVLHVDHTTIALWEKGRIEKPWPQHRRRLQHLYDVAAERRRGVAA